MSEQYGPFIGDYRRWLWAQIEAGATVEEATKDAPACFAVMVAAMVRVGRRRAARIQQHLKVITGPGPDARSARKV